MLPLTDCVYTDSTEQGCEGCNGSGAGKLYFRSIVASLNKVWYVYRRWSWQYRHDLCKIKWEATIGSIASIWGITWGLCVFKSIQLLPLLGHQNAWCNQGYPSKNTQGRTTRKQSQITTHDNRKMILRILYSDINANTIPALHASIRTSKISLSH